jgi:hypothetical protein
MDQNRDAWGRVGRISAFGLTAGITMLVCGWLGAALDRRLGTMPVFTTFLFLAGGASALWYGILKILK